MKRTTLRSLALLTFFLLAATGCSDDDSPTGPSNSTFDHARSSTVDGLELTVSTPAATVDFGASFRVRIELTNVTDAPIALDFLRGEPARYGNLTLNIDDVDALNHFAASDGERDLFELAAGATIASTFTWNQESRTIRRQVDPGLYSLDATVAFDDRASIMVRDLFVRID